MSQSMISSANLHHLNIEEIEVNAVRDTTWVKLGPIAVFGRGDRIDGLNHLREIFQKALNEIDKKIERGSSLDPANDIALPSK